MKSTKWPVVALLFLSPLIGEYLLGSMAVSMLSALPVMMAMYGAGAILIREVVQRRGGGWVSIVLLAAAFGLFEEGFVTQSLFNPSYLHLRLLDFGWLPALGIALPWTLFVITIHAVWSITVPISLTESAFSSKRNVPWLGGLGLTLFSALLIAGFGLIAIFTHKQSSFVATPLQFGTVGVLIAALCFTALRLPAPRAPAGSSTGTAVSLFCSSIVAGSAFMLVEHEAASSWHWPWPWAFAAMMLIEIAFVAFVFTRERAWSERQRFALMAGAFMVYVWKGFGTDIALHGRADLAAHSVLAVVMCVLLVSVGVKVVRDQRGMATTARPKSLQLSSRP